jgi:eukaryotic-like serine/threonine-protein kinase
MDAGMLLVGRYRLDRPIGAGGMGRVWAAHDTRLGRDVALKVQQFDPADDRVAFERFQREAQSAAGLQHPNVVTIFDSGTDGDTAFLVMELLPDPPCRRMWPSGDLCRSGRPSHWRQPLLRG